MIVKKMKWIIVTFLLNAIARGYHNSCIKKMRAIGEPVGEYVSDFEVLDRYGKANSRIRLTRICTTEEGYLHGIQLGLVDVDTGEGFLLSSLGDMNDYDSVCNSLALTSEIEMLRVSTLRGRGVSGF